MSEDDKTPVSWLLTADGNWRAVKRDGRGVFGLVDLCVWEPRNPAPTVRASAPPLVITRGQLPTLAEGGLPRAEFDEKD